MGEAKRLGEGLATGWDRRRISMMMFCSASVNSSEDDGAGDDGFNVDGARGSVLPTRANLDQHDV